MNTKWHWIRALLLCIGCGIGLAAMAAEPELGAQTQEDSGFRWWWSDDEETEPTEEETPWMITSPFANVTWPEIKMPRISLLPPWGDEQGAPNEPWLTTPFTRARQATRGAIDRTRTAWNSAVERMKFALPGGEDPNPPQVAAMDEPSLWERMFGRDEPDTGPSSVGDLMATESERDPSRIRR